MTDPINAFRDPIWQFIGAALALVALAFSIWVFLRSQKKNLFYEVAADESLLTLNRQFTGDVKVLVNGEPVEHARLMVIRFITGKVPIKSDDFERPLSINVGSTCRVLSAVVAHASPMNLDPKLILDDHKILISPLLLNQGDTFSIKILVSDCPNIGPVDASMFDYRINGVKNINLKKDRSVNFLLATLLLVFLLIQFLNVLLRLMLSLPSSTAADIVFLLISSIYLVIGIAGLAARAVRK